MWISLLEYTWARTCAYVLRKHAYTQQASLIQSDAIEAIGGRHDGFRSCPRSFKAPKIAPSRVVCPVTWPSSSQLTVNAASERTRSPFSRVHDRVIFFKHTINEHFDGKLETSLVSVISDVVTNARNSHNVYCARKNPDLNV